MRSLLSTVLVDLNRSLDRLPGSIAGTPADERPGAIASVRSEAGRVTPALRRRAPRGGDVADRRPVMVRIMSHEGGATGCRWANREWVEFTGQSTALALGDGWLERVHPDDRDHCGRSRDEADESRRFDQVEYRLQRRGGGYASIVEIRTPRFTSHGTVAGYLATAIETSAQEQAGARAALQHEVAQILLEDKPLEEVAAPILKLLCEGLDWDVGEIWSDDPTTGVATRIQLWASPSFDASGLRLEARTPSQRRDPIWTADLADAERFARRPEVLPVGLHGTFCVPVLLHGEVHAHLRFWSRQVRPKDGAVAACLISVGAQVGQFLERQRNFERVRESAARTAAILESSLDGVITVDHRGHVVAFNGAAEAIFGYRCDEVVGRAIVERLVAPAMRPQCLAAFARYEATGAGLHFGKRFDATAIRSGGAEFPVEVSLAPIAIGHLSLVAIHVCEATARKDARSVVRRFHARQRSLMTDLLMTEERERRRLAVDLHDGLSQTIALSKLKLAMLRHSLAGGLVKPLAEIEGLIAEADRAARSISFELSPPVLHDLGLEPAVRWLVENIQVRYGVAIVLEIDGQPKPADETIRVILFRSIRELLINAAKHARARSIRVQLARAEGCVEATIEDDGVGMEPHPGTSNGAGLISIRERMNHVGGSMCIESAPGRGTKVRLRAQLTTAPRAMESVGA
jgi:PAS domain S-box-containing protein